MLCCLARLAWADVDPSGGWTVVFADPVPPFCTLSIPVNMQGSGTELSTYVKSLSSPIVIGGLPYPLTGSIDSVSGAFTVSGAAGCGILNGGRTDSIIGTFASSGDTFAGTMSVSFAMGSPIFCTTATGAVTGTRISPT
jgi:hypothetical protein